MTPLKQRPINDDEAINSLDYSGIYQNLAICQYKSSRQQGKSIEDSLEDTYKKVLKVTNKVIGDLKR